VPHNPDPIARAYFDDRTAAEYVGCSERHMRNLRSRGALPYVKLGKLVRIARADLDALLAANRRGDIGLQPEIKHSPVGRASVRPNPSSRSEEGPDEMKRRTKARRGRGEHSVYQRKDGLWTAVVEVGIDDRGKRQRTQIYARTKDEVMRKLAQRKDELAHGDVPRRRETNVTVGSYFQQWLDALVAEARRAPGTLDAYRACVKHVRNATYGIGDVKLRALTPELLEKFYARMKAAGVGDCTRKAVHKVVSQVLTRALRNKRTTGVMENAADLVDPNLKPRYSPKEQLAQTAEEAHKFIKAVRGHRLEALFIFLAFQAPRWSEAAGLKWGDIDFDKHTITIERQWNSRLKAFAPTKTGKTRVIPMTQLVADSLKEHKRRMLAEHAVYTTWVADPPAKTRKDRKTVQPPPNGSRCGTDDLVFVSTAGTALNRTNVANRDLDALQQKARLRRLTPHCYRRGTASILAELGTHPTYAAAILGHSSVDQMTLAVYTKTNKPMERAAADALDRAFSTRQGT